MDRFTKLRDELAGIIKHSEITSDPVHSLSTHRWVLALCPDALEELQIAALAHDIDRAVPPRTRQEENESYDAFRNRHAKRSAELIAGLLPKYGYDKESIDKVVHYVQRHEVGGDTETDFLMDADSISYFMDNIPVYLENNGRDRTKEKIAFMYVRTSPRAKEIISNLRFDPHIDSIVREALQEIE